MPPDETAAVEGSRHTLARPRLRRLGQLATLAVAYYAAMQVGYVFVLAPLDAALVWPAAGVGVAGLLLAGPGLWPGIWLPALLAPLLRHVPVVVALAAASTKAALAVLAAHLLRRRLPPDFQFTQAQHVAAFGAISAGVAALGAAVGSVIFLTWGRITADTVWANGLTWTVGDLTGILLVTPLLVAWVHHPRLARPRRRWGELGGLGGALAAGAAGAFGPWGAPWTQESCALACVGGLAWAAARFDRRTVSTLTAGLALVATWGTAHGAGTFRYGSPGASFVALQAYLILLAGTGLVPTALAAGRRKAEAALHAAYDAMEGQVRERTADLARRTEQLETLRDVTEEVARELDPPRLLALIARRAADLIPQAAVGIFLWDEASQTLVRQAYHGPEDPLGRLPLRLGEGLIGTVAARRTGLFTNDYRAAPYARPEALAQTSITAAMGEPLLCHEHLLGVIAVSNQGTGRTFAATEQDLLRLFAAPAAIAIENARFFRDEHDRRAQLEALRATTADLTRELDLTRLLRLLIARAAELVGASSATVYLWEPEQGMVVPAAWHGLGDWQATIRHRPGQGIAGTVAQTRRGVLANDYRTSRYANPVSLQHTQVTASLGEPLLYREELIGAITLNHENGRTFTTQDQALLRLFADQAAIAITNARLFRDEHNRRAQLEAVRSVSAEITQELLLANVLRLVARRACELTGASAADIDLWDPDRQVLVAETSYGHTAPRPATTRRLGEGAMGTVAQTRRGLILNDYRSSPIAHPETVAHTHVTASLVEPLIYRETLLGVIGVDHETPGRTFTIHDRELLRLFADQAAIAIANARLYTAAQQALKDLQQAQDELVRAEKLRGLGQMAAGIAHDLNNMLATILGQTELLRLRAPQLVVDEGLQMLQTAANDGAQVVRRLQDFARQRSGGPLSSCDLSPLVIETLEITRPRWQEEPRRKGIVIEASVELAGLPSIQGNPAEIREVLTNLIFNAVDAMPNGGSLRFSGRVQEAADEQPQAWLPGVSPSRGTTPRDPAAHWVELAVSDTGIGMTNEVQRRIFDPFFTTKGLHGTGLGLSVVYGVIERHSGQIDVTSAPGQGTTFRLRFRPASPDAEGPAPHPPSVAVPTRRILLVDDDPGVRYTLAALLRASGQEVLEADSGAAALDWLATTPVDFVLTDLGMPEVTGWDVARAAKARDPNLPVVLLTGWGDQVGAEAPQDVHVDRVLPKPVPCSAVLALLAELAGPR